MEMETLRDLYVDELKDLWSAEKQILKALPRMVKAATARDLKQGFSKHERQTREHVRRLERIFKSLEQSPRGKKCVGMEGLLEEGGKVVGVRAETPSGTLDVHADLTIGADGRHSLVRERAGLSVLSLGAPMDVLWMRLSRKPADPGQTFGRFNTGRILVLINREDYWQIAYVIPKGSADELRERGLPALREIDSHAANRRHGMGCISDT